MLTRVLFFSHDRRGLGHLRRTLLLCEGVISQFRNVAVLVVTGSQMAHAFRVPTGMDYIKLPTLRRTVRGEYESPSLDIPCEDLVRLREELLVEVVRDYMPDVIFIDTPPLAATGEMMKALRFLRRSRPNTRILLNLRDILDDARVVVPLWRGRHVFAVLDKYYDRICVYGEARIYDLPVEYEFPARIAQKVSFCGYLPRVADGAAALSLRKRLCPGNEALVVVMVGGGVDGEVVIGTYLEALSLLRGENKMKSVVILGPDMSPTQSQQFRVLGSKTPDTIVVDFVEDPVAHMEAADLVVSMAGYNTINEIASLGKKAIVIPRREGSSEQRIRARRFCELGMVRLLEPEEVTAGSLARNVEECLTSKCCGSARLQCTGIDKLSVVLQDLVPSLVRSTGYVG